MSVPRTLFVNQSSDIGGGELALLDFVRHLPGSHVAVFAPGPFLDALNAAGVSASVIDAGRLLSVRREAGLLAAAKGSVGLIGLMLRLARLARGFDLVYANSQKAFIASAPAAWIARRPLVWHLHDIISPDHFSSALRRGMVVLANRFATRLIANSRATKDAFRGQDGRAPVTVIHNGIDPVPFGTGHDPAGRAGLAARIGSGSATIVGLFGRLSAWKGQDVALRALADLPDHHLILIGGALFADGPFEQHLKQMAEELEVADRVHFFGFRTDVPELMRSVDIVIHCSTSPEPFGRVIVEGMMAGAPVIASAAGGALEIVEDERTGLLVEMGDHEALAERLRQLRANPEQSQSIAARGREEALRRFSLAASVEQLQAVLNETVADD